MAISLADFVNGKNVWVIQCGSGARLLLKPAQTIRIVCERRRQKLQRDLAAQFCILRQIDFAHAATAQRRENLVMANRLSDVQILTAFRQDRCAFIRR